MASRTPSSSVMAKTLIQVAYYHVGADAEHIARLKLLASKLPPIPFELTAKNKALLRQFESDGLRAKLLFLPEQLMAEVTKTLETGRVDFVKAQVAIAIDFQLAIPLRPQNLSSSQLATALQRAGRPEGPPAPPHPGGGDQVTAEDFVAEVPDDVAQRLRWYRRHILPRLNADLNGDLFVTKKGKTEGSENHHRSNHQGDRALPRRPHDAAPVPALLRPLLSRREPRRHRDGQGAPRPCLDARPR